MYNRKIIAASIGLSIIFVCVLAALNLSAAQEVPDMKSLMPQAEDFKPVYSGSVIVCYKAFDKSANFLGTVFKTQTRGYASVIAALAAMDSEGKILAVKILSENETRGLGARVKEESFLGQFKDKFTQDLSKVEAISGATISSRAVIDSVARKAEEIIGLLKNGER
jgi:Na+-translocating ferredoxin:NAD+ oxidoreductase subunit G